MNTDKTTFFVFILMVMVMMFLAIEAENIMMLAASFIIAAGYYGVYLWLSGKYLITVEVDGVKETIYTKRWNIRSEYVLGIIKPDWADMEENPVEFMWEDDARRFYPQIFQ